ncbi:MAG: response regulator [Parvibaculum sp.]|nr:response regulator [Parvibaculum sp.]
MHRVLLISGDPATIARAKRALETVATVMSADPAADNVEEVASQFRPDGILVDSDIRMGAHTAFERLSTVRQWFPDLPMIVIGNEAGAQLILTAMRAGAQDFIDRDAADDDLRNVVSRYIASGVQRRKAAGVSRIVTVLSGGTSEEDGDFAVNLGVAVAAARPDEGVLLVDLNLPASNAAISLGLDLSFRVKEAVKEMSRLDRALLDSALARCPRSGLYVLPLVLHGDSEDWNVNIQDLHALLEICQSLYDVVVVSCGPFSRQEELVALPGEGALFFIPCNQRFTSIKGASELLRFMRKTRSGEDEPILVVHEFAPGMAPDAAGIVSAVGAARAIDLPVRWSQLAESVNRGEPLALSATSPYAQQLLHHLQDLHLVPLAANEGVRGQPLKLWARKFLGVLP